MVDGTFWSPGVTLEEMEKRIILRALQFYRGNKTATSSSLGIAIRTLDNKLEKYESENKEMEKLADERNRAHREKIDRLRGGPVGIDQSGERAAQRPTALSAEAPSRVDMEPAQVSSQEFAVSMPKREEVQELSSSQPSRHRDRRAR